jgi:hypothetical protein
MSLFAKDRLNFTICRLINFTLILICLRSSEQDETISSISFLTCG